MTPTTEPPLSAPRHSRQGTGGFDLFNPFGTSVLWPFASRRFGLGWLYVLDPVVTGLLAVALALSWWSTVYRYALPRWAFGMLAAYALVAGVLGRVGDTQWRAFLADRGIERVLGLGDADPAQRPRECRDDGDATGGKWPADSDGPVTGGLARHGGRREARRV